MRPTRRKDQRGSSSVRRSDLIGGGHSAMARKGRYSRQAIDTDPCHRQQAEAVSDAKLCGDLEPLVLTEAEVIEAYISRSSLVNGSYPS
jgi:hypothetical protein